MKDCTIRNLLQNKLKEQFSYEPSIILSEMGLCQGEVRADMVVVNGKLHGYEIKSDFDDLDRLPKQVKVYGQVLDYVTIVTGKKHYRKVRARLPACWGIMLADDSAETPLLEVRPPRKNHQTDPFALVQLLWRDEAIAILAEYKLDVGLKSKPRRDLWHALVAHFTAKQLNKLVRDALKRRDPNWRPDAVRT